MKKFQKITTFFLLSALLSVGMVSNFAYATYDATENAERDIAIEYSTDDEEEGRTPFSDDIKWCYKTIGGKWYKRQYNYSKSKWIGEWEKC